MNKTESVAVTVPRLFEIVTQRGVLRILPGLIIGVEKFRPSVLNTIMDGEQIEIKKCIVRIFLESAIEESSFLDIPLSSEEEQVEIFERISLLIESYMEDEGESEE
jgi:hypothetical protein